MAHKMTGTFETVHLSIEPNVLYLQHTLHTNALTMHLIAQNSPAAAYDLQNEMMESFQLRDVSNLQ
jgi:hypothetical protein